MFPVTKRPAVFLDRDGVLIATAVRDGRPYAITESEPAVILDGVRQACTSLKKAGLLLVLVTNQPDVARGETSRSFVERTNAALLTTLGLDEARTCYHEDRDACACRKPKPGLLTEAAAILSIDLESSFMVGDRWRDVEAGRSAGCWTVFIDRTYHERRPEAPDHVASDLHAAVSWILATARQHEGFSP
ncbi:MAG TPA: HAD-IIIA family hydrolase [Aliidongia sp.]|uniref:D-glycero-alpha-D-manno-heptose-1,7-bisphosphate 7-phosphatase n=1 Tax=Aliidongia sp. TaxID=1914230 RepID=UPI002DDD9D88|nr:HAD-IIIA family hydrolase [Aliidongia sp.]HEV2677217.1 HAD-IIIA family hydrolase [Aliidongia sp.]